MKKILSNGVLLPVFDLKIVTYDLFMVALDVVFMIVAYLSAHLLAGGYRVSLGVLREDLITIVLVCTVQFVVFSGIDVYKTTLRQFGLVDALKMTKWVFVAVLVSGAVLTLIQQQLMLVDVTTIVLDFYFLASLVVASRVSFRMLTTFFHQEPGPGKPILIYGADDHGMLTLRRLYEGGFPDMTPEGFLDDNPLLDGKELNGLPIFGGHWKFEHLVRTHGIHELILSSDGISPEVLRRLHETAQSLGVAIRRVSLSFEDVTLEPTKPQGEPSGLVRMGSGRTQPVEYRDSRAN